jgi:hypothetical protein
LLKTLTLLGQEVAFVASDNDYYLDSISPNGPVDIQRVFHEFCQKNKKKASH